MQDEFDNNLGMARTVKTFLEDSANKPIWFNQPPMRFTTRAAELYPAIDSFSTLAASQSVGPKGSADQQNIYETALEDACYPLANALHEYYLDNSAADQAAEWDLSLTAWRKMREQSLLGKAERLIEQLTNLTNNLPPKGAEYGINASAVTALSDAADNYGDAIGKPTARRAQRSALNHRQGWSATERAIQLSDVSNTREGRAHRFDRATGRPPL